MGWCKSHLTSLVPPVCILFCKAWRPLDLQKAPNWSLSSFAFLLLCFLPPLLHLSGHIHLPGTSVPRNNYSSVDQSLLHNSPKKETTFVPTETQPRAIVSVDNNSITHWGSQLSCSCLSFRKLLWNSEFRKAQELLSVRYVFLFSDFNNCMILLWVSSMSPSLSGLWSHQYLGREYGLQK